MRATKAILPHLSAEAIAKSIEIFLNLNHHAEAEELARMADECDKSGDELDAQRLVVWGRNGTNTGKTIAIYKRLSADNAVSDAIKTALVRFDIGRTEYRRAIRLAREIREKNPVSVALLARAMLFLSLAEKGSVDAYTEARLFIEKQAEDPGADGDILFLRAFTAAKEHDESNAKKYLIRALENGFSDFEEIKTQPYLKKTFCSFEKKIRMAAGREAQA
jgi:hypothetical protein